jgi:hypothetical protein
VRAALKFITLKKMDGQTTVVNIAHIVLLFESGQNTRLVMSNGMDIYLADPMATVQKQLDEAIASG